MTNILCYRCGTVNKVELEDGEHKIKCRKCWALIHLNVVTKAISASDENGSLTDAP